MCGIALIVSGIKIQIDDSSSNNIISTQQISSSFADYEPFHFTINELKAALRRRGPNNLGAKKVFLEVKETSDTELLSYVAGDEETEQEKSHFLAKQDCTPLADGENGFRTPQSIAEMYFIGAVLQLRGTNAVAQPLVDASGNVLIYNGEIFGGIHMSSDSNDTEVLMHSLGNCCCCQSHGSGSSCGGKPVPVLLSSIKGPWAMIYWQNASKTLWFGRDAFGRRSLLVHWPTPVDSRFLLSSVSAPSSATQSPDSEIESKASNLNYWEELQCGVYSIPIDVSRADECLLGKVRKHEWVNSNLKELIKWERMLIEPKHDKLNTSPCLPLSGRHDLLSGSGEGTLQPSTISPAHTVLDVLRNSVARRTTKNTIFKAAIDDAGEGYTVPVAVLFSGGLDSMILAAILHECLDARYAIDLLNVSFEGEAAPDRITARAGVRELRRIAPLRKWRLVEIDASLSNLTMEMNHVMSLIDPAKTYMDLNIGIALWLAAGGDGWVYEADSSSRDEGCKRFRHRSEARILLVGSGADEQCAGYGRHRTKYRNSSWLGLHEEMKLDMQRIWKRNLGRDDRCIADNGKEARFPFLDEDVIRVLLDFPLWEIANLNQPSGTGDKMILREVARLLGLHEASVQPKRAIQFGSRIAQASNRRTFGSNRAANQASAGSVVIHKSSS